MAESQPSWEIMIAKQPEKTLRRLPQDTFQQINQAILTLAQNPRPPESRQLVGHQNLYRLRPDGWRIIYAIEDERLIVLILEIAARQEPERYKVGDPFDTPISSTQGSYGPAWFVIYCYADHEEKVKQNLLHRIESMDMEDKIYQVIIPGEAEAESEVERDWQVSPGSILVEMILDEDTWYVVKNTPGVTGYYGSENKPTPLHPDQVPYQVEERLNRLAIGALLWPEETSDALISRLERQGLEFIGDEMLDTEPLEDINEPRDEDLTRIEEELGQEDLFVKSATDLDNIELLYDPAQLTERELFWGNPLTPAEEFALVKWIQRGVKAQEGLETKQDLNDDEIEALEKEVAGGKKAKRRLAKANAGLVIKVVEPFIGRGLNYSDLIQQGNLGLLRAAETFDFQREYNFSVYATWWIRQAVGRAVDQAGAIYLPADMVETINKWVRTQRRLAKAYGRDPSPKEMALEMDLLSDEDVQTIREALKNESPLEPIVEHRWQQAAAKVGLIVRIALEPLSLSAPVATGSKKQLFKAQLRKILPSLSEREQRVLGVRFGLDELLSIIYRVSGEATMKAATHLLKPYNMGMFVEIGLSVANLPESVAFYEKLGLKKIEEGKEPHLWAVLSDERLIIGLYQNPFPSPMLNYFDWSEISTRVDFLKTLNVTFDHMQTLGVPITPRRDNFVIAAEFEAFEGQRVRLTHLWSEKINPGRNFFARCDKFGELSLKTANVDAAVTYWKQLGFHRIAGDDRPYPWATLTDGTIRLGLHQTSKFAKPTISYFAPDMPDRLKQLRKAGLKFLSEHKDAQGQRIGAVVQSPDGQPFFLFTGQVASPN